VLLRLGIGGKGTAQSGAECLLLLPWLDCDRLVSLQIGVAAGGTKFIECCGDGRKQTKLPVIQLWL
jgi:hypothetical protein